MLCSVTFRYCKYGKLMLVQFCRVILKLCTSVCSIHIDCFYLKADTVLGLWLKAFRKVLNC